MAPHVRRKRRINFPLARPASSNALVPLAVAAGNQSIALAEIDRRIASAQVQDLPALIQARSAIIEQDEVVLSGAQTRRERMATFYSKVGFSAVAAIGGGALIASGFGLPGFFLLGGAAAVYVPGYVKDAIGRLTSGSGDAS